MNTISESPFCPRCGSPVPADAPGGQCPKCLLGAVGAATEPPPAAAAGEWPTLEEVRAAFPDLEVTAEIGRGGMAVVFKARQLHLDRPVALKILAPWLAAEPGFAERFSREARVLAKLNHPNIVTIHDFGQAARFFFLLMEYVDGVNLRQAMQAGRFEPAQALSLVPKICDALQYAHSEGILHRDIKPDNILLDARGRVKIADFGIAKLAGEQEPALTLTRSGMRLGTPAYMAPEQVEKPGSVDHRADIYSLGVVLYEMLTGELPLGRFAPPSEKASVDERIDEIVMRTLEKERERRYQSAEEFKTRVEGLGNTPPPVTGALPAAAAVDDWEGRPTSPKSLWGAVATGLSLCGMVLLSVSWTMPMMRVSHGPMDPPPMQSPTILVGLLLLFLVGGVAVSALSGILLGASALGDMHRSAGRVGGAGLAAFAALTWPLLLMTGAGAGLSALTADALFDGGFRPTPGGWLTTLTFLAGLAGVLWLDITIVRRVLRWARGESVGHKSSASMPTRAPATVATVVDRSSSDRPNQPRTSGLALASGILAMISLIPVVFLLGLLIFGLVMARGRMGLGGGLGSAEMGIIFFVSGIPSLIGTILGVVAMNRIRNSRGELGGAGWAVLGAMAWPTVIVSLLTGGTLAVMVARLVPGTFGELLGTLLGLGVATFFGIKLIRAAARWTRGEEAVRGSGRGWVWVVGGGLALLVVLALLRSRLPASGESGFIDGGHPPAGLVRLMTDSPDVADVVINQATQTTEWTQARPVQVERFELNVAGTLGAHRRLVCEVRHTVAGGAEAKVWPVADAVMLTGQLDGGPITIHQNFSLELPEGAGTAALQEAHQQINQRWLHQSRRVTLDKPEPIFRVSLADGSWFEAAFILRPSDSSD